MLSCKSLLSCMETNKITKVSICTLRTQTVMKPKQPSPGMMLFKCQAGLEKDFNGGNRSQPVRDPILSSRPHQCLFTYVLFTSWLPRESIQNKTLRSPVRPVCHLLWNTAVDSRTFSHSLSGLAFISRIIAAVTDSFERLVSIKYCFKLLRMTLLFAPQNNPMM